MRKIDLKDYQDDGKAYPVKQTITLLLFNPDLRLVARDLISQDALARKIEESDSSVLLEETEYQKVKLAVETAKGWQRGDLEFVRRILEAPEVPVKEG